MSRKHGFTLVEILIVVLMISILAAVIIPRFATATEEAAQESAYFELQKLRRAIEVYIVQNEVPPDVTAGVGTWGTLVTSGNYLKSAPKNHWVGNGNEMVVTIGATPDTEFQTTHGWIYDNSTGDVWAGGFDEDDKPLPKP